MVKFNYYFSLGNKKWDLAWIRVICPLFFLYGHHAFLTLQMFHSHIRCKGNIELKKENSLTAGGFKVREVVIHPTLLSYRKPAAEGFDEFVDPNREIDTKRDFLLGPQMGRSELSNTETIPVGEDTLVIATVQRRQKLLRNNEIIGTVEPKLYKQITMRFESREVRDTWMRCIVAECGKIYLVDLLSTAHCDEGFVDSAHAEIWSHILMGDEALRKAYCAVEGSPRFESTKIVVNVVTGWLLKLLAVSTLAKSVAAAFVELFSLMLEDVAARAFFVLTRPSSSFFEDFRLDETAGLPDEQCKVAARLVEKVRLKMQVSGWQPYRSFLLVVTHPFFEYSSSNGMCLVSASVADSIRAELLWLREHYDSPCEFSWWMCKAALNEEPYLSYFFIVHEIREIVDDEHILRALRLLECIPEEQLLMAFAYDNSGRPVRKRLHFKALLDYCKFREVWKLFCENHACGDVFFDAVHVEIWSRISLAATNPVDVQWLSALFLPTDVNRVSPTFVSVLGRQLASTNRDVRLLQQLNVVPVHVAPADESLHAMAGNRSVKAFRLLAVDGIVRWVQMVTARTSLVEADAPMFVSLLIACAKSAVFRAVLRLILPSEDAVQEAIADPTNNIADAAGFCTSFIAAVEAYSNSSVETTRFLSFLCAVDHPLALQLRDAVSSVALGTAVTSLRWFDEMEWMDRFPQQEWMMSWSSLKLIQYHPPYLTLRAVMRRLHDNEDRRQASLTCLKLLAPSNMNQCAVDATFYSDVNVLSGSDQLQSRAIKRDLHFLTFVDSLRVTEVWKFFESSILSSNVEFLEVAQSRLLHIVATQRNSPGAAVSGFASTVINLMKEAINLDTPVKFSTVISRQVWIRVQGGDEMWISLLSFFNPVRQWPPLSNRPLETAALERFKVFIGNVAIWCMHFHCSKNLDGSIGIAFADLLSACLKYPALRAVCAMVTPGQFEMSQGSIPPPLSQESVLCVLTSLVQAVSKPDNNDLLFYLLHMLGHPGISSHADGSLLLAEPSWELECDWLFHHQRHPPLEFDHGDFAAMANPAYLLFRHISRDFYRIDHVGAEVVVDQLNQLPLGTMERVFSARMTYLPCCRSSDSSLSVSRVEGPHFKYLMQYCLYNETHGIVLRPLVVNPVLQATFLQRVVLELWQHLTANCNAALRTLFLPTESDFNWTTRQSYVSAVQCHAVAAVAASQPKLLSSLYPRLVFPNPIPVLSNMDHSAHGLLLDCALSWTRSLLGDVNEVVSFAETEAVVFVALFTAITMDAAMRAFVVTFSPSPSLIAEFMASEIYQSDPIADGNVGGGSVRENSAAVRFVRMLSQTFCRKSWLEYRSFMALLEHPVKMNSSGESTAELFWEEEAKWICSHYSAKPKMVFWEELRHVMTDSPYVLLMVITKAVRKTDQQQALMRIPAKYLAASFNAINMDCHSGSQQCRTGAAPHFVAMCLADATQEYALRVFEDRRLMNDGFFKLLLQESCVDGTCPRILQAFNLMQGLFYIGGNCSWNIKSLRIAPNIASVLINFLSATSKRTPFVRDEKIIGNLILLVLHLEASRLDSDTDDISNVATLASEWMRRDVNFINTFFQMLDAFNFVKWFSNLCWNNVKHFCLGTKSNELEIHEATLPKSPNIGDFINANNFSVDIILDEDALLFKNKLSLCIVGFVSLCIEFQPSYLCEFLAELSPTGRPFFVHFLHEDELLTSKTFQAIATIMDISMKSQLYQRLCNRYIFYDNDHATPDALSTIGLRHSHSRSACLNLTLKEFSNLLTVAMYLHDINRLNDRFERVIVSIISDQEHREMVIKFTGWIISFFIEPDVQRENNSKNSSANRRSHWLHCRHFATVSFEDIIACSAEATVASQLLRNATLSTSYDILERLFIHYLQHSKPVAWLNLFRGCKTIAYFIKYVDVEDLNLAFSQFQDMNPQNNCFQLHLLQVRKLLVQPVVSSKELVQLTSSGESFSGDNADIFFGKLKAKGKQLPPSQVDLKIVYYLTASWMKISKDKVLFPLPPRNAQIITLLTVASWAKSLLGPTKDKSMGKALIAQVGTGEGKSLIIAMMAIYFVKVLGKRVHILENNPGLLAKDIDTMSPLFAEFNIKPRGGHSSFGEPDLTSTTSEKLKSKDCRNEFCDFGVTYCLRKNMERYYQDCVMHDNFRPMANTVLIVDEVDDLIVDDQPNRTFACKDSDQPEFQRACEWFKNNSEIPGDHVNSFVWQIAESTSASAKKMVLNLDYTTRAGTYVVLEGNLPLDTYDKRLELLKFNNFNTPPSFKTDYYYQSIPYILSQYDCICGFSGSLGSPSEREFLREQYKAWCFDTPSFLNTCTNVSKVAPTLMDDAQSPGVPCVHVFDTAAQQVAKIIEMCLQLHFRVPVLVIAKSTSEAIEIEVELRRRLQAVSDTAADGTDYIQLFLEYVVGTMTLDKDRWGSIVRRATSKKKEDHRYCITVTDPFGGRGHDFDVHDENVEAQGGLAVIMTSIPASDRVWKQWKGRTARKDNRGQYAVVLCSADLPISLAPEVVRPFVLKKEGNPIPNLFSEELVDKLLHMQDESQSVHLSQLRNEVYIGKRLNRLCDLFYQEYGGMDEGTWPATAEQVILRNLLMDPAITSRDIDKVFHDLQLNEHDSQAVEYQPPDILSSAFWSDGNKAEWNRITSELSNLNYEGSELNPKIRTGAGVLETSKASLIDRGVSLPAEFHQNDSGDDEKNEVDELIPVRSPKRFSAVKPKQDPSSVLSSALPLHRFLGPKTHEEQLENPSRPRQVLEQQLPQLQQQELLPPCPMQADSVLPQQLVLERPNQVSAQMSRMQPPLPMDPFEELGYDFNAPDLNFQWDSTPGIILEPFSSAANAEPTNMLDVDCDDELLADCLNLRRNEVHELIQARAPKRVSTAKAVDAVFVPPTIKVATPSVLAGGGGGTSRVDNSALLPGNEDSSRVQSSTGVTMTSEKTTSRLLGISDRLRAVQTLSTLRIGSEDEKVQMAVTAELKDMLGGVTGAPLTVGVFDIEGPNATNGVPGLEVSGSLEKRLYNCSLIFSAKVISPSLQYNLDLYGPKRLVATWNGHKLMDSIVEIKPALTLRPKTSFVFHNAVNAERITAAGTLIVSSGADPRSASAPVFRTFELSCVGGRPVELPVDSLPNAVVTVTPQFAGFTKKSEMFVLYNREFSAEEAQVNLNPATLVAGQWRVVLTWGEHPKDLDLYCVNDLAYPPANKIYWECKNTGGQKSSSMGMIELDTDVRYGKGPETITLTPNPCNHYRFFVHNFTGQGGKNFPISDSGAKVVVHKASGDFEEFEISPEIVIDYRGRYGVIWHVFDILNGEISPFNTVVTASMEEICGL